jgi:hypothetical protein
MPLFNLDKLTKASKRQKKEISEGALIERFVKSFTVRGQFSFGDAEPRGKKATILDKDGKVVWRIDLQEYNHDGDANLQLQGGTVSYAAVFIEPNVNHPPERVVEAFQASLDSDGTQGFLLSTKKKKTAVKTARAVG